MGLRLSHNRFNWQTFHEVIKPKSGGTANGKFYSFPLTVVAIVEIDEREK